MAVLSVLGSGCSCSKLSGEVGDVEFKRCAQVSPPDARSVRAGEVELRIEGSRLEVRGKGDTLRLAAFTGPVGAALTRHEIAALAAAKPQLVVMLGGLGETTQMATASLAALSTLDAPTLFLPGGADRLDVLEQAFDELSKPERDRIIQGSGLRELVIGDDHFALVAGAPLGRYAIDDGACGFETGDLEEVAEALEAAAEKKQRLWLLSWGAPSGWGVSPGYGHTEVGSDELAELVEDLGARGGLFAFPESAAGLPVHDASPNGGLRLVVPRLGRTGATRLEGGRVASSFALLSVGPKGLTLH